MTQYFTKEEAEALYSEYFHKPGSLHEFKQALCEAAARIGAEKEREEIAKWVEPQRNDIPATGIEFAAAIRNRSTK